MKKLLLLGGLYYLRPIIEAAHRMGVYVITCDYIPDNIAHKYSDEYHNISIIDKDAVLNLAQRLEIDGIMSFAVDPGVVTAAYVAEKMGLPFAGSYEAVKILQNKDIFRKFLYDNGFNVPMSRGYTEYTDAETDLCNFRMPVIVKPTDSAGSKGVTKVCVSNELKKAFIHAKSNSLKGRVIIEEFIEKRGYSSDCDSFSIDGKMVVTTFNAQYFDNSAPNPYTPGAYSWPSTFTTSEEKELCAEIQRLVTLLNLKTSIYNIETRVSTDGKPYIMELSPRGGGNRLAEMEKKISGCDLIEASVRGALNMPIAPLIRHEPDGFWTEIILHSQNEHEGRFDKVDINEIYRPYVECIDMYIKPGDTVKPFNAANDAIGTLVMHFPSREMQHDALSSIDNWCKIILC